MNVETVYLSTMPIEELMLECSVGDRIYNAKIHKLYKASLDNMEEWEMALIGSYMTDSVAYAYSYLCCLFYDMVEYSKVETFDDCMVFLRDYKDNVHVAYANRPHIMKFSSKVIAASLGYTLNNPNQTRKDLVTEFILSKEFWTC